jgi:hypothetical protein
MSMNSERDDLNPFSGLNQYLSGAQANANDMYNTIFNHGGSGRNHRMSIDFGGFLNKHTPSAEK